MIGSDSAVMLCPDRCTCTHSDNQLRHTDRKQKQLSLVSEDKTTVRTPNTSDTHESFCTDFYTGSECLDKPQKYSKQNQIHQLWLQTNVCRPTSPLPLA